MTAANEAFDRAQHGRLLHRPPIVLTTSDRDSLSVLLRMASTTMDAAVARFLGEELERADVISGTASPTAAVSIGSTVQFIDAGAMNTTQVKLVLPDEADGDSLISVTAARGSALIGLGPGRTIRLARRSHRPDDHGFRDTQEH